MKLTFPYVFKPKKQQKEILEEIMWHCAKVYNMLNYDIQQGVEKVNVQNSINIESSKIYKKYREENWHSKYLHSHTLQEVILNQLSDRKSYLSIKENKEKYKMEMIYEKEEKAPHGM